MRNLWTHSVIMCGHFPEGVATYEKTSIEGETRAGVVPAADARFGEHLRQRRNAFHDRQPVFQIEHHLFPDLPSNRYQEIAPKVQESSSATD